IRHRRPIYLREAEVAPELDTWLTTTLNPRHLPATLDALAAAQHSEPSPEAASLREEVAACDRQLDQYRATLDAGGDPGVVGQWITETQARKLTAETRLRACQAARPAPGRMTKQQIAAVADAPTGLMDVLPDAEPADTADIYAALGLRLTYHPGPGPRMATVSLEPGRSCTKGSCPRGDLNPHALNGH